jgi:hypothetical protein
MRDFDVVDLDGNHYIRNGIPLTELTSAVGQQATSAYDLGYVRFAQERPSATTDAISALGQKRKLSVAPRLGFMRTEFLRFDKCHRNDCHGGF